MNSSLLSDAVSGPQGKSLHHSMLLLTSGYFTRRKLLPFKCSRGKKAHLSQERIFDDYVIKYTISHGILEDNH